MSNAILALWESVVARFYTRYWNNNELKLSHSVRNSRRIFPLQIIPLFWDSEIVFELNIRNKGKQVIGDTWTYHWELCSVYEPDKIIKSDKRTVTIPDKGIAKFIRNWGSWLGIGHIPLGYLIPNRNYSLYVNVTNKLGSKSDKLLVASFTIKDRDEVYMQIFLIIFSIVATLIFSALAKGCGL